MVLQFFGLFSVRRRWIYRSVEASKFMATCYSSLPSSFGKSSHWGICFKCLGCLKFINIYSSTWWLEKMLNETNPTQVASFAEMHLTSHEIIHFWTTMTTSIHKFSFLFRGSPASNMNDISKYLSRGWCGLWT